jgi:hypothetical protein
MLSCRVHHLTAKEDAGGFEHRKDEYEHMKTLCFLAACMLSAACAHQPPPETLPTSAITEANGGRYRVTFHAPQSSTRWWVMVCDGDPYHSRSCDVNDSMVQGPEGQGWLRSFPVEIRLRSLQPDCRPADTQPPSNSWFAVESPRGRGAFLPRRSA